MGDNESARAELTLERGSTLLHITPAHSSRIAWRPRACVFGTLDDQTKISLIDCPRNHLGHFLPNYVVVGECHFAPDSSEVRRVRFAIDGARTLFCPSCARKRVIFSTRISIATVSAFRGATSSAHPSLNIDFRRKVPFDEAMDHVASVLQFTELLVGRPQVVTDLTIDTANADRRTKYEVYWCGPPRRRETGEHPPAQASDVLIQAAREPRLFARILRTWIRMQSTRATARARFRQSFAHQCSFFADRLVGATDMFDLLPPVDNDSGHDTPGMGRNIQDRAALVSKHASDSFPELKLVISEALACRDFWVHGTRTRIDYRIRFEFVHLFIEVLEFVFAASELLEAGWDLTAWTRRRSTHARSTYARSSHAPSTHAPLTHAPLTHAPLTDAHPFDALRATYPHRLAELKQALRR